jgi:hypothetical protein
MDSNAAAKLQRPPPHADDDELPAPAPPEGRGRQRTLTGARLRAIAVLALFSDYCRIVGQNLVDGSRDADEDKLLQLWRVPALLALAYAVVAALIWFIELLERRRLLQPADDRDAHWEGRVKLAARFMVHTIINLLIFYSSSVTPCALFMFMWVKSSDQVYIKVQKEEESDEEKQYQVLRCDL